MKTPEEYLMENHILDDYVIRVNGVIGVRMRISDVIKDYVKEQPSDKCDCKYYGGFCINCGQPR